MNLLEYRERHSFDIPTLAWEAKVPEEIIHRMLIGIPAPEEDARRLCTYLGEQLDISTFVPPPPPAAPPPTFKEILDRHGITPQQLAEKSGFRRETIDLLYLLGEASPILFVVILDYLYEMTGIPYSRKTVGGVTFVARLDFEKVRSPGVAL